MAVADFDDEVTDSEIDGETLYLLANKEHPRGRCSSLRRAPPLAAATGWCRKSAW